MQATTVVLLLDMNNPTANTPISYTDLRRVLVLAAANFVCHWHVVQHWR
jgi:hypothetical protein